jgi:hypothetical protein
MSNKTKLALRIILAFVLCTKANAGYVDVGWQEKERIETRFHADGFIIDADSDSNIGLGFGVQRKEFEVYVGGGDRYAFSEFVYKNHRYSIYNLGIDYKDEQYQLRIAYTHLFSDSFGLVGKYNFKTKHYFFGFRKWIK